MFHLVQKMFQAYERVQITHHLLLHGLPFFTISSYKFDNRLEEVRQNSCALFFSFNPRGGIQGGGERLFPTHGMDA